MHFPTTLCPDVSRKPATDKLVQKFLENVSTVVSGSIRVALTNTITASPIALDQFFLMKQNNFSLTPCELQSIKLLADCVKGVSFCKSIKISKVQPHFQLRATIVTLMEAASAAELSQAVSITLSNSDSDVVQKLIGSGGFLEKLLFLETVEVSAGSWKDRRSYCLSSKPQARFIMVIVINLKKMLLHSGQLTVHEGITLPGIKAARTEPQVSLEEVTVRESNLTIPAGVPYSNDVTLPYQLLSARKRQKNCLNLLNKIKTSILGECTSLAHKSNRAPRNDNNAMTKPSFNDFKGHSLQPKQPPPKNCSLTVGNDGKSDVALINEPDSVIIALNTTEYKIPMKARWIKIKIPAYFFAKSHTTKI
ncbi:hypothetical protein BDR26DRAFT_892584 [Obelidium mucronatum]|nr:hypothetical protein BDR26DRAFT_892584 [Obelidium mucronatum]